MDRATNTTLGPNESGSWLGLGATSGFRVACLRSLGSAMGMLVFVSGSTFGLVALGAVIAGDCVPHGRHTGHSVEGPVTTPSLKVYVNGTTGRGGSLAWLGGPHHHYFSMILT